MKIAYFDCSAGISGDMCLGALVDAGVSLSKLRSCLKKIPITGYRLSERKVRRNGIAATKVDVILTEPKGHSHHDHAHHHKTPARKWTDVKKLIASSTLEDSIKRKGLAIFRHLFEAEAAVHGESVDHVHLHELGAVDCIVDIFGTLIGLEMLGVEKVFSSPVNTGQGTVNTAHGLLPIPAPATLELLKGCQFYSSGINFELTTPTGAAILSGLVEAFGPLPGISAERTGYGAGNREIADIPNAFRLIIGENLSVKDSSSSYSGDRVIVLETNIDDMNPQYYEGIIDKLLKAGALDVFLENISMKKSRPAIKITAIIRDLDIDKVTDILFSETTTIGVRYYSAERRILNREIIKVKTSFGAMRFKVSRHNGKIVTVTPEYEDLRAISDKTNIPVKEIVASLPGMDKIIRMRNL
jgi:uncharacterized protein (TIGR00299 family) protein